MPRITTPTAALLLSRFGQEEIARRAASTDHTAETVDGTLLDLTVTGGNRSAYTAAQQTAADNALTNINRVLKAATADVSEWIGRRDVLWHQVTTAQDIILIVARYKLYDDSAPEDIRQVYQDARDEAKAMGHRRIVQGGVVRV